MTPEQIQQERAKYGIPAQGYVDAQKSQDVVKQRASKLDEAWGAPTSAQPSLIEGAKQDIAQRQQNVANIMKGAPEITAFGRPQLPIKEGFATAGQAVGLGADLAERAVSSIPIVKSFQDLNSKLVSGAYEHAPQGVKDYLHDVVSRYQDYATQNPREAKDVEALGNILRLGMDAFVGKQGMNAVAKGLGITGVTEPIEGGVMNAVKNVGTKGPSGVLEMTPEGMPKPSATPDIPTVTDAVAGATPAEKATNVALKAITPNANELTPDEYKDLLRKGKISPKTALKPAQYILSDEEKTTAQKYAHLLQNEDPVKNSGEIMKEIITKDDEVGKYLDTKTTQIWSKPRFKQTLLEQLKPINDVMVPESRLAKAKNELVSAFVNKLPKNATLKDLWTARKQFDSDIESKLNAFAGSPTLKKDMARGLRNAVQDFIAESTNEPVYKGQMKEMSKLYDLADIVDTKAVKEKGRSGIAQWLKENPSKAKALKWGAGIVGAEEVYRHVR